MKSSSCARGMTLVETMITMTVVLLGVLAIGALLDFGVAGFNRLKMRGDAQQSSLVAINHLSDELTRATWRSVTVAYPGGSTASLAAAVAFASPLEATGRFCRDATSGLPVYQAFVIYYRDAATNRLLRRRLPLPAPSPDPAPLTTDQVLSAAATGSVAGFPAAEPAHVLSTGTLSFEHLSFLGGLPVLPAANPLRFRLEVVSERNEKIPLDVSVRVPR